MKDLCGGKIKHSKTSAGRFKKRYKAGLNAGADMLVYECSDCHSYHLTTKRNTMRHKYDS